VKRTGEGEEGRGGTITYKYCSAEKKGSQMRRTPSSGSLVNRSINNNKSPAKGKANRGGAGRGDGAEPLLFGQEEHDAKRKAQHKQKGPSKANFTLKVLEKKPLGDARVAAIVTLSNTTIA